MAGGTRCRRMCAAQCEIADGRMIKSGLDPTRHCMTTCAVRAKAAFVDVIPGMTTVTGRIAFRGEVVSRMAGTTGQAVVTSIEGKSGQPTMIEFERRPVARNMTITAFITVAAFVYILVTMTVHTAFGDLGEHRAAVATVTSCTCMRSSQQETRQVMFERRFFPLALRMAVPTRRPELAFVRILLAMTRHACGSRFRINLVRAMTGFTGNSGMRADQGKVSKFMLKKTRLKHDDFRIPAFMIRMTGRTVLRGGQFVLAMETAARIDIAAHPLVARDAQFLLGNTGSLTVALRALAFNLLVHRCHRTRHHQFLQHRPRCGRCKTQRHANAKNPCS